MALSQMFYCCDYSVVIGTFTVKLFQELKKAESCRLFNEFNFKIKDILEKIKVETLPKNYKKVEEIEVSIEKLYSLIQEVEFVFKIDETVLDDLIVAENTYNIFGNFVEELKQRMKSTFSLKLTESGSLYLILPDSLTKKKLDKLYKLIDLKNFEYGKKVEQIRKLIEMEADVILKNEQFNLKITDRTDMETALKQIKESFSNSSYVNVASFQTKKPNIRIVFDKNIVKSIKFESPFLKKWEKNDEHSFKFMYTENLINLFEISTDATDNNELTGRIKYVKVQGKYGDFIEKAFETIQFFPIRKTYINTLQIKIKDHNTNLINFNTDPVICNFIVRKK